MNLSTVDLAALSGLPAAVVVVLFFFARKYLAGIEGGITSVGQRLTDGLGEVRSDLRSIVSSLGVHGERVAELGVQTAEHLRRLDRLEDRVERTERTLMQIQDESKP